MGFNVKKRTQVSPYARYWIEFLLLNRVQPEETTEQIQVLADSIRRYKKFRRNQLLFNGVDQEHKASKKMSIQGQGGFCFQDDLSKRKFFLNYFYLSILCFVDFFKFIIFDSSMLY